MHERERVREDDLVDRRVVEHLERLRRHHRVNARHPDGRGAALAEQVDGGCDGAARQDLVVQDQAVLAVGFADERHRLGGLFVSVALLVDDGDVRADAGGEVARELGTPDIGGHDAGSGEVEG